MSPQYIMKKDAAIQLSEDIRTVVENTLEPGENYGDSELSEDDFIDPRKDHDHAAPRNEYFASLLYDSSRMAKFLEEKAEDPTREIRFRGHAEEHAEQAEKRNKNKVRGELDKEPLAQLYIVLVNYGQEFNYEWENEDISHPLNTKKEQMSGNIQENASNMRQEITGNS